MLFLYKKPVIHFLTIVTGIYIVYYLYWRISFTLNYSALIFSLTLLVGEIIGMIDFFLFALMTWNTDNKNPPLPFAGARVDVFVPTYNEDLEILEATLIGCINMRYEHITYVLDDGRRPEAEVLARQLGCVYLTRPDNKHAKAGNINEALKKTNGEFVVVLDADMVPQPDFIEKTIGYFKDGKTAIVQLPQEFYNTDSVQHQNKAAHWHEQQLFYHVIQPGKNNINSPFWCGSPSVLRREALESIGGVATESITEDFLTSIKLNAKGWKIKYHHEVLAFGIAPQTLHAFNVQRLRWAQGSMKILKSKYNPLIAPGLTIKQRLSHFAAIFTYFDSYQKLIFLLVPALYLLTGLLPIRITNGLSFLINWTPYFVLVMLTNIALGRGYFSYFDVEKFNTLKMFTFIKASFTLIWSKNMVFRVTPKKFESSVKKKERNELVFQIIMLMIILASILLGTINTLWNLYLSYSSIGSVIVAIFWSVFNAYILIMILFDVLKRMYNRQDFRFSFQPDASITEASGEVWNTIVSDISRNGIRAVKQNANSNLNLLGSCLEINLHLPDTFLNVSGHVVYEKATKDNSRILGIKFDALSLETRKQLYIFLFVTAPKSLYNSSISRNIIKQTLVDAVVTVEAAVHDNNEVIHK